MDSGWWRTDTGAHHLTDPAGAEALRVVPPHEVARVQEAEGEPCVEPTSVTSWQKPTEPLPVGGHGGTMDRPFMTLQVACGTLPGPDVGHLT
jgi:hypothetical protein